MGITLLFDVLSVVVFVFFACVRVGGGLSEISVESYFSSVFLI